MEFVAHQVREVRLTEHIYREGTPSEFSVVQIAIYTDNGLVEASLYSVRGNQIKVKKDF